MVSKRRPIHATNLNFRPVVNNSNNDPKGTKPTSEPTSIREILTLMVLYLCKKSLFFDTNIKVALYLGSLFLISIIADAVTVPKTYLSRSDNIFNKLFVKFAWGWNLTLLIPFVLFTSLIYCCGNRILMLKHHLIRLGIATFFWWFWTTLFNVIEAAYGRCSVLNFDTKAVCLQNGHVWNGLDLSGHCFILIYGSLFAIEETRCIVNWDAIKEFIRLEEYNRSTNDNRNSTNPLRNLSDAQLKHVKHHYEKYTPYIRILFVLIAVFQVLWDIMLVSTMLYYHIMIEKFLGGVAAILTWFITYRVWYSNPCLLPKLPGEGEFKYIKNNTPPVQQTVRSRRRDSLTDQGPLFMGRPIYAKVKEEAQQATR